MSNNILDVLDGARYVEKVNFHSFAVWHGGHTVNFYTSAPQGSNVEPTGTVSVGDFETGEVTLEEVKDGIEAHIEER